LTKKSFQVFDFKFFSLPSSQKVFSIQAQQNNFSDWRTGLCVFFFFTVFIRTRSQREGRKNNIFVSGMSHSRTRGARALRQTHGDDKAESAVCVFPLISRCGATRLTGVCVLWAGDVNFDIFYHELCSAEKFSIITVESS
jgi:hypothetical protein